MRNLAVLAACSCLLLIPSSVSGEAECDTSLLQHKLSLEQGVFRNASDLLEALADSYDRSEEETARTEVSDTVANASALIKELASMAAAGLPGSFEMLSNDLTALSTEMDITQDLLPQLKDAFNSVLEADKEAAAAEAKRLKALAAMKPELNTTIESESAAADKVPAQVHELLPAPSGIINATAAAVESASTAAELAKVVVEAEKEFAEALAKREKALEEQTRIAASMQLHLETTILTALNDTRMVTALNASDRLEFPLVIDRAHIHSTSPPTTSVSQSQPQPGAFPYPSEFVVIALLILLAIAIAALASLQRPAA